jgi:hypothetical protein
MVSKVEKQVEKVFSDQPNCSYFGNDVVWGQLGRYCLLYHQSPKKVVQ